jgi:hypothetical protein
MPDVQPETISRRPAIALALAVLVAGPLVVTSVQAGTLTMYERMAQADLVVHVRIIDGKLRLAECEVLEVLKGSYEAKKLFVAFRADNMSRARWRDRITFEDGATSLLLLVPALDEMGQPKSPDRFRLVGGVYGKVDLPKEGADAYIQAFRRLGEILEMTDIHQIWQAHRKLILETNPYLVETGFAEILKFRLGNEAMVPTLLDYLDSRHDRFRASSMAVLSQIFHRAHRTEQPLGNEDHVVARLLTVAIEDPSPEVRVAAVRALHAYGRPDIVSALERVARQDPSQDVRYEATLSVYRLNRRNGVDLKP